jgi:transformation/transcription domain-associated protein
MKTKLDGRLQDIFHILHQIANRFSTLCLDDPRTRKSAGGNVIRLMINPPQLGVKWIAGREVDTVRTLLYILKCLP